MVGSTRSLLLAGLLASLGAAAHARLAQDKPAQDAPAPAAKPGDIVVTGRLGEKSRKSPLLGATGKISRDAASDAHKFVRCLNGIAPSVQRSIVEGHGRDPETRDALDHLIQSNTACYPRLFRPMLHMASGYYGDCNPVLAGLRAGQTNPEPPKDGEPQGARSGGSAPQVDMVLCRSGYDRGAIVEEAFRTYAPHFMLTRADTLNRDVVSRFRAREAARGKHRSPMDRRYYDTVSCMVQLEPESAVRLIRAAPGGGGETQLRMQILERTGYCTGNAKNVRVDPSQFRGYLADALYHWTVAAKNVETLIPAS